MHCTFLTAAGLATEPNISAREPWLLMNLMTRLIFRIASDAPCLDMVPRWMNLFYSFLLYRLWCELGLALHQMPCPHRQASGVRDVTCTVQLQHWMQERNKKCKLGRQFMSWCLQVGSTIFVWCYVQNCVCILYIYNYTYIYVYIYIYV